MRALLCLALLLVPAAAIAGPDAGEAAPPFSLMGSDGKLHELSDFVGKRELVLAWFPKAFTPG